MNSAGGGCLEDENWIEKVMEAGKILRTIKKELPLVVKPGVKLLEIAEFVESRTVELGAFPAFPCNISVNSDAAHFTPRRGDERVLEEGSVVKVDIGAHVDGYIADTAITFDFSSENQKLVEASEKALENAIATVKAGVDVHDIGKVIEETIKKYGLNPIYNLTGHGLKRWIAHTKPTIYNHPAGKGVKLEEGMCIAIEPFVTNGIGKVVDRNEVEIFSLPEKVVSNEKSHRLVRMRQAREVLIEAMKYRTLPFAKRWLKKAPEIAIAKLVKARLLRAYPVLAEVSGGLVAQTEHTLIVEKDSAVVVT